MHSSWSSVGWNWLLQMKLLSGPPSDSVGNFCSLLNTTADSSVSISVEDAPVYLSKDSISLLDSTACLADINYLDLSITLMTTSMPRALTP